MKKIIFILLISINIAYSQGGGQMFVIEDPAVLSLKFPLQVGAEWTAKSDSNITIVKEVIGRETLTINGNDYDCLKVSTDHSIVGNNEITRWHHSWIAKEGLIKTMFYIVYTSNNNGVIDTITGIDEIILTDIDLK